MEQSARIMCGWKRCADMFSSELDMNVHVQINHMMYAVTLQVKTVQELLPAVEQTRKTTETPRYLEDVKPQVSILMNATETSDVTEEGGASVRVSREREFKVETLSSQGRQTKLVSKRSRSNSMTEDAEGATASKKPSNARGRPPKAKSPVEESTANLKIKCRRRGCSMHFASTELATCHFKKRHANARTCGDTKDVKVEVEDEEDANVSMDHDHCY